MSLLQAITLGIVQGLTEFLPISSSGHLLIIPYIFKWETQPLAFDAIIHLGTLVAVILYFRKDIAGIFKGLLLFKNQSLSRRRSLALFIGIGILPAGIAGFLLNDFIEEHTRSIFIVIFNLIFWGIFLIAADYFAKHTVPAQSKLTFGKALTIGLFQTLSLLPGTSRSGVTIAAGIFSKLSKKDAARFSFLMSAPLITAAGIFKGTEVLASSSFGLEPTVLIAGLISSCITGLLALTILMRVLEKSGLTIFGVYRIALAVILLLIA